MPDITVIRNGKRSTADLLRFYEVGNNHGIYVLAIEDEEQNAVCILYCCTSNGEINRNESYREYCL